MGKVHAKWCPVGTVAMKYIPIVTLNKELLDSHDMEYKQRFVDSCPRNVFTVDPDTQRVLVKNAHACMFCGDCEQFNTSYADKVVTISQIPNKFEFVVESTGSVRPLEILKEAIRVLEMKMMEISNCMNELLLNPDHCSVCEQTLHSFRELIISNHCVSASDSTSGSSSTDCTTK